MKFQVLRSASMCIQVRVFCVCVVKLSFSVVLLWKKQGSSMNIHKLSTLYRKFKICEDCNL